MRLCGGGLVYACVYQEQSMQCDASGSAAGNEAGRGRVRQGKRGGDEMRRDESGESGKTRREERDETRREGDEMT